MLTLGGICMRTPLDRVSSLSEFGFSGHLATLLKMIQFLLLDSFSSLVVSDFPGTL
jgi:hypothetical protein